MPTSLDGDHADEPEAGLTWTGSTDVTTSPGCATTSTAAPSWPGRRPGRRSPTPAIAAQGSPELHRQGGRRRRQRLGRVVAEGRRLRRHATPVAPTVSGPAATNGAPTITWTVVDRLRRLEPDCATTSTATACCSAAVDADGTTFTDAIAAVAGLLRLHGAGGRQRRQPSRRSRTPARSSSTRPRRARPGRRSAAHADVGQAGPELDGGRPTPAAPTIARYEIYRGPVLAGLVDHRRASPTAPPAPTRATTTRSGRSTRRATSARSARRRRWSTTRGAARRRRRSRRTTPTNPKPVLTWTSGGADNLSGLDQLQRATATGTPTSARPRP